MSEEVFDLKGYRFSYIPDKEYETPIYSETGFIFYTLKIPKLISKMNGWSSERIVFVCRELLSNSRPFKIDEEKTAELVAEAISTDGIMTSPGYEKSLAHVRAVNNSIGFLESILRTFRSAD